MKKSTSCTNFEEFDWQRQIFYIDLSHFICGTLNIDFPECILSTTIFLQVKTQLAEKALQAAKAAEAALAGKQAVVEQLQQEVKEAEAVVAENTAAVHQQQGTVNAAVQAAQQATAQVSFSNCFF